MANDDSVLQISDVKVLAAMVHPLRRRLLTLLKFDGPSTGGALAERTGQAPGNVSHHLRVLATAGLVEEVPALARDRRERWWQTTAGSLRWSSADFVGDPADEAVARAAAALNLDEQIAHVHDWSLADDERHAAWPLGPFNTDTWIRATDAELAELADEITAIIGRWAARELPDDGQDREPVFVFARGVPATP